MAATKPPVSQRRMQPTSFALEGRPMSSESLSTIRRKFLTAPIPEPPPDDDQDEFHRPPKVSSAKGKKKKKKKVKKESFDLDIDVREKERLQELKEKHMRVLDDLEKLKAHYYLEYMDALTDKVEDQRKDIQRKSEQSIKRRLKKEKKQREAAQKAKIQMHHPEVSTDNTFLRGLSKTKFHNIVILQGHLAREGRLKTDEHVRAYWEQMSKPENYRKIFGEEGTDHQDGAETSFGTKPTKREGETMPGSDALSQGTASESIPESGSPSLMSLRQLDPLSLHHAYLDQIQEVKEPSRPNSMGAPYLQSWIQQPKIKKKAVQALIIKKPVHPKVLEMEQKCPRVEFPKLAAFTLDLEPPKEDPEVELMREEFRSRARLRNAENSRLRKMYQSSLTNNAATQRIFDMKDEFNTVLNGPSLGDVLYAQDPSDQLFNMARRTSEEVEEEEEEVERTERLALLPPDASPHHQGNRRSGSNPGRPSPGFAGIERISEEGDLEEQEDDEEEEGDEDGRFIIYSSRSSSRRSSLTSTQSDRRRNMPVTPEPPQPFPLTLDAVMDHTDTKVVKRPSALWVNYGKFLPPVK
ncbi:uncharacterized protein LOC100893267 isoform X2 [Strongylocentrotus purpuratus]|uniref:Uncharacterized protein n=1 Tax=Strongylocentrotus purpuratus TaxID=7668 RepID=A0A7M7PJE0_STRPU|nr:uncharacterized protein LOC100893267 isoform X2 [Strongylocentrotus purpuratus]